MAVPRGVYILLVAMAVAYLFYYPEYKGGIKDRDKLAQPLSHSQLLALTSASLQEIAYQQPRKLERVAIGCNANLDLIVRAIPLMKALKYDSPPHEVRTAGAIDNVQPLERLESVKDLATTLEYFFRQGSAAERYCADGDAFQTIVEVAATLDVQDFHSGGNAALIANAMSRNGVRARLAGPVGNKLRSLLEENVDPVRSFNSDQVLAPDQDEVHLIMEFSRGERWGTVESPRDNRFITSHDLSNSNLVSLDDLLSVSLLGKDAEGGDTQLVVLSGVHLMEGLNSEERGVLMNRIVSVVEKVVAAGKPVHLELASVGDADFLLEILQSLVPRVHSIGLNEQELSALLHLVGALGFKPDDFVSPTVDTAMRAYSWTDSQKHASNGSAVRLCRIHLHDINFHAIGLHHYAEELHTETVARGSIATSAQACGVVRDGNRLPDMPVASALELREAVWAKTVRERGDRKEILDLKALSTSPVVHLENGDTQLWVAPVLVCRKAIRTVGLGDTISATGLTYHAQPSNTR